MKKPSVTRGKFLCDFGSGIFHSISCSSSPITAAWGYITSCSAWVNLQGMPFVTKGDDVRTKTKGTFNTGRLGS